LINLFNRIRKRQQGIASRKLRGIDARLTLHIVTCQRKSETEPMDKCVRIWFFNSRWELKMFMRMERIVVLYRTRPLRGLYLSKKLNPGFATNADKSNW
jgi:hypothetical protein